MSSPQVPNLTARNEPPQSISVVVPCYNEESCILELSTRLIAVLEETGVPFEIVFVDDGSGDRTWELLAELSHQHSCAKVVKLSRNFGHQRALTCGLDQTKGEIAVIIDADLQDPPELITQMIEKWQDGYDVVYAQRNRRDGESSSKRLFAYLFYRTINYLGGRPIPLDSGDFRLMDRKAIDALNSMRETQRFIRGMVSWVGFPQCPIIYDREKRYDGVTKYPFRKSFMLALDAITSFSYSPLRLASYLGIGLSAVAFLYIIVVIILKLMGINFPGYTSMMATILLLGGVQLIVLGVIGEYVGRIFEQTKHRPLYFIETIHGEPLLNVELSSLSGD